MIIPRVKSEKPLDIVHVLPSPIAVYTCDAQAEKAFDALRIFMPTVVFVKAQSRCAAQIILECRPSVSLNDEYYSIDASALPIMVRFRAFIGGRNAAASLAQLINNYKGTMLVVTHNRYLLNHCFNKILHLEDCDIQEFDQRD